MIRSALFNLGKSALFETKATLAQTAFSGQKLASNVGCKLLMDACAMRQGGAQSLTKSASDLSSAVKQVVMQKASSFKTTLSTPGTKALNSMPSEATVMKGVDKAIKMASKENAVLGLKVGAGIVGAGLATKFALDTKDEITQSFVETRKEQKAPEVAVSAKEKETELQEEVVSPEVVVSDESSACEAKKEEFLQCISAEASQETNNVSAKEEKQVQKDEPKPAEQPSTFQGIVNSLQSLGENPTVVYAAKATAAGLTTLATLGLLFAVAGRR